MIITSTMDDYNRNCPLEDCPCFVRDIIINIQIVNECVKHTNLYPYLKYSVSHKKRVLKYKNSLKIMYSIPWLES